MSVFVCLQSSGYPTGGTTPKIANAYVLVYQRAHVPGGSKEEVKAKAGPADVAEEEEAGGDEEEEEVEEGDAVVC